MEKGCSLISFPFPKPSGKGKQGDMSGLFDRCGYLPLVAGAGAGLAPRAYLALFCDIAAQHIDHFVVNVKLLVSTELAGLRSGKVSAFSTCCF
jgi:hypothetical protein